MKNRGARRERTHTKFVARIKKWFQIYGNRRDNTWVEFLQNNKWLHMYKHNKVYGRSTMNNMEKKKANKTERREAKKIINEQYNED